MKIIQISALWCSSCLIMKKVFDTCKKEFPEIEWVSYDLDFDNEAKQYQVSDKLPVLIFEKNGIEVSRLVGEKKKEEVSTWILENQNM